MNAIQAHERLTLLNKRIDALNGAYKELWRDFDNRRYAVELEIIRADYEREKEELVAKLSAMQL
jgi:hypothetical protein